MRKQGDNEESGLSEKGPKVIPHKWKRQSKADRRSASFQTLLKERAMLHTQREMQEKGPHS